MDIIVITIGSFDLVWLLVVIEPNDKEILVIYTLKERNMFWSNDFSQGVNKCDYFLFLHKAVHGIYKPVGL